MENGAPMTYQDFVTNDVFPIVEGKKVLEIGPLQGELTKCIEANNPSFVHTVEPAFNKWDTQRHPNYHGTANDFFNENYVDFLNFDVVVIMGVLYHLHSPFHLLELIINKCRPEYLILETSHAVVYAGSNIGREPSNTLGNAYSDKGINFPININSAVVKQDIITGIETTPMKLYKYWDEYEKRGFDDEFYERSKSGMWLGIFKWKN